MLRKTFSLTLATALCLLLTACSVGPIAVTPMKTYTLNNISAVTPSPTKTHSSITVMPVVAIRGLDTNAMVYETRPYLLADFEQNAWIAPPASMITALIGRALQQTNAFTAVVPGPSFSNTDYTVNATLVELYQDFTVHPSQMVISLDISLVNNMTNAILADRLFSSRTPATEETPYGGVIAANQAVNTMMQQISQFLISEVIGAEGENS